MLPHQDAIAALVADLGSDGGAWLQVVRYFEDPGGEEEQLSGSDARLQKLTGQHQLLGWHLDHEVIAFLGAVGAQLDVDEYG